MFTSATTATKGPQAGLEPGPLGQILNRTKAQPDGL